MKTRLLNRCKTCGGTWFPRGFDFSGECPHCRSGEIDRSGPFYLAFLAAIAIGAGLFWASDRAHRVVRNAATPEPSSTPSRLHRPAEGATPLAIVPARITTQAEGTREALRLYPALGVADSPLNREFITRYHSYQRLQPDFFDNPAWPVILAKESAAAIGKPNKVP
jgi:hypothetical protein